LISVEAPSSKIKKPHPSHHHAPELLAMATSSAATLVADHALKKPPGPGLDRQPKTLNAMGKGWST
jgi:hypothetical protein